MRRQTGVGPSARAQDIPRRLDGRQGGSRNRVPQTGANYLRGRLHKMRRPKVDGWPDVDGKSRLVVSSLLSFISGGRVWGARCNRKSFSAGRAFFGLRFSRRSSFRFSRLGVETRVKRERVVDKHFVRHHARRRKPFLSSTHTHNSSLPPPE